MKESHRILSYDEWDILWSTVLPGNDYLGIKKRKAVFEKAYPNLKYTERDGSSEWGKLTGNQSDIDAFVCQLTHNPDSNDQSKTT